MHLYQNYQNDFCVRIKYLSHYQINIMHNVINLLAVRIIKYIRDMNKFKP